MKKIAVITKNGSFVPFLQCDRVEHYEKRESGTEESAKRWSLVETLQFDPVRTESIQVLRAQMHAIEKMLEPKEVVAVADIAGIPFTVLDQAGHCIFTITDKKEETLDGIYAVIWASDEKARRREEMILNACPVETNTPGIYELDLVTLQRECPEVSSKKALKDFLKNTPFLELRIQCAHMPPWLEQEQQYECKSSNMDGVVHVRLNRKQCEV